MYGERRENNSYHQFEMTRYESYSDRRVIIIIIIMVDMMTEIDIVIMVTEIIEGGEGEGRGRERQRIIQGIEKYGRNYEIQEREERGKGKGERQERPERLGKK